MIIVRVKTALTCIIKSALECIFEGSNKVKLRPDWSRLSVWYKFLQLGSLPLKRESPTLNTNQNNHIRRAGHFCPQGGGSTPVYKL